MENVVPLMQYLLNHFSCIKDKYVFNLYLILIKVRVTCPQAGAE